MLILVCLKGQYFFQLPDEYLKVIRITLVGFEGGEWFSRMAARWSESRGRLLVSGLKKGVRIVGGCGTKGDSMRWGNSLYLRDAGDGW